MDFNHISNLSFLCGEFSEWPELKLPLHDHFRQQVEKTPNNIAIVDGVRKMTYQELNYKTDILSNYIVEKYHILPDDPVGIFMDKSIEFVISYISILKAGGAYSPIEVTFPVSLLQKLTKKIQFKLILTKMLYEKRLPQKQNKFSFDNWKELISDEEEWFKKKHKNIVTVDNIAYLVFSSGTTGKPKGISCPHIGSVNSYFHRIKNIPYIKGDRIGCNIFFTWELFRPLIAGYPLYIIPQEIIYSPVDLCDFIFKNEITRILLTPSTFQAIFDLNKMVELKDKLKSLRLIIMCGEVVKKSLFEVCQKNLGNNVKMINLYSVSECHDVCVGEIAKLYNTKRFCSTGKIMNNTFAFVLNEDMEIVKKGEVGELYVGGITLAREYVNQKRLTAFRFVKNPFDFPSLPDFIKEKRLYKAGDLAKVLPDNSLEIIGRSNSMVKIRGYSVELTAIESFLNKHSKISSSAVIKNIRDEKIVGYVVLHDHDITGIEIKDYLKEHLPFYMIPDVFMKIEKLPININFGKLDVSALPDPKKFPELMIRLRDKYESPTNDVEQKLYEIWQGVYGDTLSEFGIEDNFFDLGGNSISLAKLFGLIKQEFKKLDITLPMLYERNTIKRQAELIIKGLDEKTIDFDKEIIFDLESTLKTIPQIPDSIKFDVEKKNYIMLTGGTGFLGAFLIDYLLKVYKNSIIYCLVRGKDGKDRLKKNLILYDLYSSKDFDTRIEVVEGDFSLQKFGFSKEEEWYRLSRNIDFIVHCGAEVNFVKNYEQLKSSNVEGTRNIIKFAVTSVVKPLLYVSTNGVFLDSVFGKVLKEIQNSSLDFDPNLLDLGYSQSKLVAEKAVIKCIEKYRLPFVIFRPGDIVGDSYYGRYNDNHDIVRFLIGIIQMKKAPSVYRLQDFTPVDFVAEEIVKFSTITDFTKISNHQFNLVHKKRVRMIDVINYLKNDLKYKIKIIKPTKWVEELKKLKDNPYFSLYPIFENSLKKSKDCFYECSCWDYESLPDPYILLKKMIKRLIVLKKIPVTVETKTYRNNAIVMGASVGIGEAISKDLAKSGTNVCLASRKIDKLESIRKKLNSERYLRFKFVGKVISKQCDVTKRSEVTEVVEYTKKNFGYVDIFVCNAGIMPTTYMSSRLIDDWERCVNVNIFGLLNSVYSIIDEMKKRNEGQMIMISSNAGVEVWQTLVVYSATKFFMEAIVKGLRKELFGTDIKVCSIQPGDVGHTEILAKNQNDLKASAELEKLTAKKILVPKDISKAVMYSIKQNDNCCINSLLIEPIE